MKLNKKEIEELIKEKENDGFDKYSMIYVFLILGKDYLRYVNAILQYYKATDDKPLPPSDEDDKSGRQAVEQTAEQLLELLELIIKGTVKILTKRDDPILKDDPVTDGYIDTLVYKSYTKGTSLEDQLIATFDRLARCIFTCEVIAKKNDMEIVRNGVKVDVKELLKSARKVAKGTTSILKARLKELRLEKKRKVVNKSA